MITHLPFHSECTAKYGCTPGFVPVVVTGFTLRKVCRPHVYNTPLSHLVAGQVGLCLLRVCPLRRRLLDLGGAKSEKACAGSLVSPLPPRIVSSRLCRGVVDPSTQHPLLPHPSLPLVTLPPAAVLSYAISASYSTVAAMRFVAVVGLFASARAREISQACCVVA